MNYNQFHVLVPISNPVNYESRYRNCKLMAESILRKGAHVWFVELATGARQHRVTELPNEHHLCLWQTGVEGETWQKEQLINLGFAQIIQLSPDARYLMWADADLLFEADMLEKTIQALQHWPVVQAWSHLISLNARGEAMNTFKSFVFCKQNKQESSCPGYPPKRGSPGGAWAFRREILNQLGCAISGPIIDFGICGSGDTYFAHSVFGEIGLSCRKRFHPNYIKWLKQYGSHVDWIVQRNVGYVSNTVRHLFHGHHNTRGYEWRDNVLIHNQFDPETDLTKDAAGLWRLVVRTPRQMKLRDDLRAYFRSRNEDTILTGDA